MVQANTKWYEGALDQSIYWAVSDNAGLTWGPTRLLIPSPDGLPLWGPVQYSAVRPYVPLPLPLQSLSAAAALVERAALLVANAHGSDSRSQCIPTVLCCGWCVQHARLDESGTVWAHPGLL